MARVVLTAMVAATCMQPKKHWVEPALKPYLRMERAVGRAEMISEGELDQLDWYTTSHPLPANLRWGRTNRPKQPSASAAQHHVARTSLARG